MKVLDDIKLTIEAVIKLKDVECSFKEECMNMPISHLEQFCGCYNEIIKELEEEHPVDVLDPKNLPPRPWKPRKREWVWARGKEWRTWALRRFKRMDKEGVYVCTNIYDSGTELFYEIAPFKGELPPGLEEEDAE